jgi:ADP-ribose pyrophosphatase YjhB (NUDIX family)
MPGVDTGNLDVEIQVRGGSFKYRAAAIISRGDHLLVCCVDGFDYVFLPGGKVKIGESAQEACEREVLEEIGQHLPVENLRMVVENIYYENGSLAHEVGFYFDVDGGSLRSGGVNLHRGSRVFRWVLWEELADAKFEPSPLIPLLRDSRAHGLRHLIMRRGERG